jgi:hypothetical protein
MSLSDHHVRQDWAREVFGELEVGCRKRVRRVVAMAAKLAAKPAGTVTDVFDDSADREGAYRMLSNEHVPSAALSDGICTATVRSCESRERVYVGVDGTTLTLPELDSPRGLGGIGAWYQGSRGINLVSAVVMDEDGVPLGAGAQEWWIRTARSTKDKSEAKNETRHQVKVVEATAERFAREAPECRPIFLMDRGFDCWSVVAMLGADRFGVILRAQQDRRLAAPRGQEPRYLRQALEEAPCLGEYFVSVPARGDRSARVARIEVRTSRVTIRSSRKPKSGPHATVNAVLAHEVDAPKEGDPISWMLLTTEPVETFEQAALVVKAYTCRWRIEEVHRAWKRGGGHVEDTQLRSREAIIKWATLHFSVAIRAVRLAQLARTDPDLPASRQFTQDEIDAAIILRGKRTKLAVGSDPPLSEMVLMIAHLGGYTGEKSSGGPPGPTVIGRGLNRVATAAEVVAATRTK